MGQGLDHAARQRAHRRRSAARLRWIRAVDHERDRSKALVLCDRPDPTNHPGRMVASTEHDILAIPPQIQLPAPNGDGSSPMAIPDAPKTKGPDLDPQKLPMPRPFNSKAGPAMPKDVTVDIDLLVPASRMYPGRFLSCLPPRRQDPVGRRPGGRCPADRPAVPGEPMIRIPMLPGVLPEFAPPSSSR